MWYLDHEGELFNLSKAYKIIIKQWHQGFYTEAVFSIGSKQYSHILNYYKSKHEAEVWLLKIRKALNQEIHFND